MERLSSGLRVNSSKDDAAGLAIANRMNSQIRGMTVAQRNANDGISLAQVAEGSLSTITDTLQRMRDLALQAANDGAIGSSDKNKLNEEFTQLKNEVSRIITNTTFNDQKVLNGDLAAGASVAASGSPGSPVAAVPATAGAIFQIGANTGADNRIEFSIDNLASASGLVDVIGSGGSIGGSAAASDIRAVIGNIDTALNSVDSTRAELGAVQNRFAATINNLANAIENQSAARSRIMDADFAVETANLSRAQILQQAGTAMLAQANAAPQSVLGLLQ